ncbi:MAG: TonB-dependent receptor plug domain-containing protein [Flammeovirgaceae bacterium]|nr:TonB-dependent receptor plug domain-containing protein [Flammeovirgaceae bacterium]
MLPDSLKAGTYYLRAYTNLQRNFGDDKLFVKPIPILNITDKVEYTGEPEEEQLSDQLTITTDKQEYKTREKITLTLQLKDKNGNPMAGLPTGQVGNFSISVTDASQVLKVPEWGTIEDKLTIRKEEINKITNLKYSLEYGVGFSGQFVNDKGKPEKTLLNFMQMKPRNVLLVETDGKGFFQQAGLNIYDTATFYYKADKAKDLPYGNVRLLERNHPAIDFAQPDDKINVVEAGSVQRIFSEYEKPKDVTMLKEVEVKARRIDPEVTKKTKSAYGAPDVLLTDQDLGLEKKGYPNLLYYIVGKVPGLDVRPDIPSIAFTRAGGQSISFQGGPLVTVNDVPMAGDPAQTLSMINPNNVESIGFTKRVNVLYGSQGAFGVISIFLKNGISEQTQTAPNYRTLTIFGYSKPGKWIGPDYDNSKVDHSAGDYRSTIYWNPEIAIDKNTGDKTFSFFAADLESTYRIEVWGVARDGSLIHFVYHVMVNSN